MTGQSLFEQFSSGVESIFATVGNAVDGATSLLGDYLEFEDLLNNEQNQGSGAFENNATWGSPTQSSTAPVASSASNNSNMLIYAAFGLVGVGALSLLLGK